MNSRKRLPIGPLAMAMRASGRNVAIVAVIVGVVLIAGILMLVL